MKTLLIFILMPKERTRSYHNCLSKGLQELGLTMYWRWRLFQRAGATTEKVFIGYIRLQKRDLECILPIKMCEKANILGRR